MSKSKKQFVSNKVESNEVVAEVAEVATKTATSTDLTLEQLEPMTSDEVVKYFGNKSNAIRAMSALGMKNGPISKKLNIRYQHARNVLNQPLKRNIKAERAAKKEEQETETAATEVQS